jgi:hypothetical protein
VGKRETFMRLARIVSLAAILVLPLTAGSSVGVPAAGSGVAPNPVNMLDCNGHSAGYQSVKPTMKMLCADPFFKENGVSERAYDNGNYVGHDEPSVKFISGAPNSGSHMTYLMQLAVDPTATPTPSGSVTHYAELSPAPWFGLPMCDPKSYPMNECKATSDTNTGLGAATDAGSAFEELQFYAPGFGPFADAISCDQKFWCAALTIDSLECTLNFVSCNPNCFEPINFAYLQRDGVPAGPPSPQLINDASFLGNERTLKMRSGDKLRVTLQNTGHGLKTTIVDLTSGQTGFMVASATNGFMNTDFKTCNGTPFDFHPEYNTASKQNQVPWAALEGGVLMQQEIGHFESCSSVKTPLGVPFDPAASWTCAGGIEPGSTGEGPCSLTTGCTNPTTEGGGPCPTNSPAGNNCEFSDAICLPAGERTTTLNGGTQTWNWPVAGCEQNVTQNGDLDFDGNSYIPDWPNGTNNFPTSFKYAGPFDARGKPYPQVQIETDLLASENDCNVVTGEGCSTLPHGAKFYPYWTLGMQQGFNGEKQACIWNFGNTINDVTTNDLGKLAEYGAPNVERFAGTAISAVMPNPQLDESCGQNQEQQQH